MPVVVAVAALLLVEYADTVNPDVNELKDVTETSALRDELALRVDDALAESVTDGLVVPV